MRSLRIVQRYFPNVTKVRDADKPLDIEVTKADNKSAKVRDHEACAMAVACKRVLKADGVIVSVTKAYVVNGNVATRYTLPESISHEVVSFDREAGFAVGEYVLNPPMPSMQLGAEHAPRESSRDKSEKSKPHPKHFTDGIRSILGGSIE
jgi:hypothetical protein